MVSNSLNVVKADKSQDYFRVREELGVGEGVRNLLITGANY